MRPRPSAAAAALALAGAAWLAGCAGLEVSEDAEGRRPCGLPAYEPRAVLVPARLDARGRPTASRLVWIPDARRPLALWAVPGPGEARVEASFEDADGFVGYLTHIETSHDGRGPAAAGAAGDLAAAAVLGAAAAGGR